jgi:serine/threonine-protein kinase
MTSTTVNVRDPAIGTLVLGRYRLVRFLARGGMGSIYLGRAEGAAGFARPVVIKRALHVGDEHLVKMFAREARILARLRHPAIVSILDFADTGGEYVMVLEYVHGYSFADWARYARRQSRRLSLAEALWPVLRVLDALAYAHDLRGDDGEGLDVVHRDVKPSNVLIDVQGDVKLADFGIARAADEVTETALSDVSVKGTLPFMAPELFAKGVPGPATDTYSAAVMLYTALAGRNPFAEKDAAMTIGRVVHLEPPPLSDLRPDVPLPLCDVIARGMRKQPGLRFDRAADLAAAVREALPGPLAEIEAEFRAGVKRDFESADLPRMLGVNSLKARAAAIAGERPKDGVVMEIAAESSGAVTAGPLHVAPLSATSLEALDAVAPPDLAAVHEVGDTTGLPQEIARDIASETTRMLEGRQRPRTPLPLPAPAPPPGTEAPSLPPLLTPVAPGPPVPVPAPPRATPAGLLAPDRPPIVTEPVPRVPRRGRGLVVAGVAVVVLAGAGVGVVALRRTPAAAPPEVVLLRGDVGLEADAGPTGVRDPAPARDAGAGLAQTPVDPGRGVPDAGAARPPGGQGGGQRTAPDYADAVRRRGKPIADCFQRHAAGVSGTPEVSVRFHIDRAGKVTQAELFPEALAGTPLGGCLLTVARGTRFGAQAEPVVVRIPITVRAKP